MTSFLIFVVACAAIVLTGWTVSKITGSRAWYVESWEFNEGETVIWRDDAADVVTVPMWGGAALIRPVRLRRWAVIVTNQRIIMGNKVLGTGKRMVVYVLYPGAAPDQQSKGVGGGLLTRGYKTIVIQSGVMTAHPDERFQPPYVALKPVATEGSSFNIADIRIYTDAFASFPVPNTNGRVG